MYAKELEIPTAVGFPSPAGAAMTAIEIRFRGALITRYQPFLIGADFEYFNS
jgi:hypothetical protein